MINTLPQGYTLYTEDNEGIVLAVTNFLEMFNDAPEKVTYQGVEYTRGPIEAIPHDLVGHACSMRRYYPTVVS